MPVAVDFDPLLKLQLEEINRFLKQVSASKDTPPDKLRGLAEHICEWTRTILSRSFGRLAEPEALELQTCFRLAADVIEDFRSVASLSKEDSETIAVFAEHVRSRVGHLPLAN